MKGLVNAYEGKFTQCTFLSREMSLVEFGYPAVAKAFEIEVLFGRCPVEMPKRLDLKLFLDDLKAEAREQGVWYIVVSESHKAGSEVYNMLIKEGFTRPESLNKKLSFAL
ncbi:hypothetical protein PM116P6_00046 [Parabacteroides phage PM116P6]|nr:hypothetical protein PM116P6_00046 [Parabacteroides phage PM116P6]WAX17619.1 hypothetical protein PM116P7_00004 [Parabacteroides phage PM116P7]